MMLTCTKCGRRHPLSEEDVVFFYPRFFCLSCGEKLSLPIDEGRYLELRVKNDRDRRLPDSLGAPMADSMRRVRREDGPASEEGGQGMDGG